MIVKVLAFIVFTVCFVPLTSFGQLKWDQTKIEVKSKVGDTEACATFGFENGGTKEVTIKSVSASCGCTAAHSDKKSYLPGQKGTIEAKVHLADQGGRFEKTIIVQADDSDEPTALRLTVVVPPIATLSPGFVSWDRGSKTDPKDITVGALPDLPLHIVGTKCQDPNFMASVKAGKTASEFIVTVTPKSTTQPSAVGIQLLTDTKFKGEEKTLWILAYIK